MKLAVYGHGGSQNHGNEAIVRGVHNLFPSAELTLYTFDEKADIHYGLDEVANVKQGVRYTRIPIFVRVMKRIFSKSNTIRNCYYSYFFSPMLKQISSDVIYLLEAGDQYCERSEHRYMYSFLNHEIKKRGAKTVMLSCTINEELFEYKELIKDLNKYDLIIARESITYNELQKHNLNTLIKQAPCPAFAMKMEEFDVPSWIKEKKFIGFNIGWLAQGNEKYYDILLENYCNCVEWVLENTDYDIALIPHVNWNYTNTDFNELDYIQKKFNFNSRIHFVEEHDAPKQKYIISKCWAFVCLRTHATIPALEAKVPTLITGYKTKSKGIAYDIYADSFDMLADVQSLKDKYEIKNKLIKILDSRQDIVDFNKKRIPEYLKDLDVIVKSVSELDERKNG